MATTNERLIPIEAIHPTELIKDELKSRGMQRKELAERLGMKAPNLSRFLNSHEDITPPMALKLEDALGIPADYWLRLQVSYKKDLEAIQQRSDEENAASQIEAMLSSALNLKVLFKRLSLDGFMYFKERLSLLYNIYKVNSAEGLLSLSVVSGRFKKSDTLVAEDKNVSTWILLARHACSQEKVNVGAYTKGNESLAAKEIASLANAQIATEAQIKSIMNGYGIGYCFVEKLEKTPVDAYSAIIDGTPYIVVSHRKNNMDMLVFDILHECGHINKHLAEGGSNISCNENIANAKGIEQEANRYAMDMLISPSIWSEITKGGCDSLHAYSLINTVVSKATKNGISPTIAAWRFKYETRNYRLPGYNSQRIR